jgi:hypothetical protein
VLLLMGENRVLRPFLARRRDRNFIPCRHVTVTSRA